MGKDGSILSRQKDLKNGEGFSWPCDQRSKSYDDTRHGREEQVQKAMKRLDKLHFDEHTCTISLSCLSFSSFCHILACISISLSLTRFD